MIARLKENARRLKTETYALYLAYRDPRLPWYARLFAALVVAYALSPIDLIPDFIPLLGYLDDAILIPAGVWVALKMIPPEVMAEARERSRTTEIDPRLARTGTIIIVAVWVMGLVVTALLVYRYLMAR